MIVLALLVLPGVIWEGADAPPELGVKVVRPADATAMEKAPAPGSRSRTDISGATGAQWIDSSLWRFARKPDATYLYKVTPDKLALAMAEAHAGDVAALFQITPADVATFGEVLGFLRTVDKPPLPVRANIAFADDGSAHSGEIMNLLSRRNLLFKTGRSLETKPDLALAPSAGNPHDIVMQARYELRDDRRLVRIYGSESVLARLTGNAREGRLFLVNYSGRKLEGVRIRVLGEHRAVTLHVLGEADAKPADLRMENGALEFTVPRMGVYVVADLLMK